MTLSRSLHLPWEYTATLRVNAVIERDQTANFNATRTEYRTTERNNLDLLASSADSFFCYRERRRF